MEYEKLIAEIRAVVREELKAQQQPTTKKFLTIKEAADVTSLKPGTLYHLVAEKKIPFIKPRGRVMFVAEDLEKWMTSRSSAVVDADKWRKVGNKQIKIG